MKKIEFSTQATKYDSYSELSADDQRVMESAITAKSEAYSPYSNFSVGAAILMENGEIITGNNQENAAYPSGMCAERVAVWKAATMHPKMRMLTIAIAASSATKIVDRPVGPCGGCRQTLLEYEINQKEPVKMLFMGEKGAIIEVESIASLLPFNFDHTYL